YEYNQRPAQAYARAWQILDEAGLDQNQIDAVFSPAPLVPVPGFVIHPFSRELYGIAPDAQLDYRGYMDLSLEVDRFGSIRGPRIDAASPEAPQSLRSALLDFLRDGRFRPAIRDGETVSRDDLKVRYYYSY